MGAVRLTSVGSGSPREGSVVGRGVRRVVLTFVVLALVVVATRAWGPDGSAAEAATEDELARGAALFQRDCAACHGTRAQGRPGDTPSAGPPIDEVSVVLVDVMLRTGRMPIPAMELGVRTDRLAPEDREALVAWMHEHFDLPGELPTPGQGQASRGLDPFVEHCAACHGAGGDGGVAGGGTTVPAIRGADPMTIAEAVRVGPVEMPAFSEALVDDATLDDIIAYLQAADSGPRSLLGIRSVDEVATAAAVLVLLAATVALVHHVARGTDDGEPS